MTFDSLFPEKVDISINDAKTRVVNGLLLCVWFWLCDGLPDCCSCGVIQGDGVHNVICCHMMTAILWSDTHTEITWQACSGDLQAMEAVKAGLGDPKCHLYPDPASTQYHIKMVF